MSESSALQDLLKSASSLSLSDISGSTLKLNSQTYDANTPITFSISDKTLTYTLISLFLQLQNPSIGLLEYKKLCKEYDVKDFVKVTEKKLVFGYFLKGDDDSGGGVVGGVGGEKKVKADSGEDARGGDRSKDSSHDKKDNDRSSSSKHHRESDRDRDRDRRSSKDHHRSSSSRPSKSKRSRDDVAAGSAKKKEKKEETSTPITQQRLLDDLNIVVDKRAGPPGIKKESMDDNLETGKEGEKGNNTTTDNENAEGGTGTTDIQMEDPPTLLSQEEEERRAIQACLTASGYEATQLSEEILKQDRLDVQKITSFEIPVGDSGTILRCGAMSSNVSHTNGRKGGSGHVDSQNQRNFARVLDLLEESKKEEQKMKYQSKHKSQSSSNKVKFPEKPKLTGNPIIIVPNAMRSPITIANSQNFFGGAKYVVREKCPRVRGPKVEIKRKVSNRLGGGELTYEIMDNPKRLLRTPADWARVVAVLAHGESWQFKGWQMGWKGSKDSQKGSDTPVEVFSHSYGFYIGFEGAPIPKELAGWRVKKEKLSKDKRGLDSVVYATFWNGLDEWMSVHKRDLLPK